MICFILLITTYACQAFGVQFAQDAFSLGVATAIDKQKDLPKNEFEPKYIVVKGVKYKV